MAIYAATSSICVTLALALMTWSSRTSRESALNGAVEYVKCWIPDVPKALHPLIVLIEILAQFMRLISLSVRLYANMLAGHMLILTFIGLIFVFESLAVGIVAVPAAAAFYSSRSSSSFRSRRSSSPHCPPSTSARRSSPSIKETFEEDTTVQPDRPGGRGHVDAGKAIALALGIGLGSLGAGVGIGNIFGSMIQAVARQPELKGELTGIQWLGFALTEAVVFYGLIGGLLAFVLV